MFEDHHRHEDEQDGQVEVQNQDTQKQIQELMASNYRHEKTIEDLWSRLQTESAKSQSIKESAEKMVAAMESKDLFVGHQDSDDVVILHFGQLVGQIKTWSLPFAAQERTGSRIDLSRVKKPDLYRVVPGIPDLDQLLQTPKNARLFVRGWVGLAMSDMLFRTLPSEQYLGSRSEDIWMDQKIARSFTTIEDRLFHTGELLL